MEYVFPYYLFPRGSRIVICGAGDEDFADDGKIALEDASGTMPIEIFDDGGSMIFVEGRRLFTIAFTFRPFLPAIAQVRQEIVAAWP